MREVKPCRGKQRKTWRKAVNDLILQLDIDSEEMLAEDYNVNTKTNFNDGLNSEVKLKLYKTFCRKIEFKYYLQGVGTRLMFKV